MNSENTINLKLRKFDGQDFGLWKIKVKNALMFLDLDSYLLAKGEENDENKRKDKKALSFVMDCLSDNLFRKYDQATTKDLWDKLKSDFEIADAQLLFVLRNKFLFCVKSKSETMNVYINRLSILRSDLKDAGNEVSDQDYLLTIMNGTHSEYGDYVSAMTGKKKVTDIQVDDLISQLIKEDDLRRTMNNQGLGNPNKSDDNDRQVFFFNNKEKNKKKKRVCYNCGIAGHYANECRRPKSEVHAVSDQSNGKEYLCNISDNSDSCDRKRWLLDSGASTHACNSSSMFEDMIPESNTILVGDNREVKVTGRGTVRLQIKSKNTVNTLVLKNVALVPDLGINLVSTGRLESQGISILTANNKSTLIANNQYIGCATRNVSNPYLYEFEYIPKETVLVTTSTVDWDLWHRRLGHLSSDYMNKLHKNFGKSKTNHFCEECHLCKSKKFPHKEKSQKLIDEEKNSGMKEGVIHSDLMGPMRKNSMSGCRYVLTYICGHTEYSYVYLLKSKSEQALRFKEFKALYERQTGLKLKELRSDNGLEYFSSDFSSYLKNEGIKHQTSVAYVPQSNGKAERLNLTLLVKARCMLTTAKLNVSMWGAAISNANYLRNRSPCKTINFKTPYEMVFKKEPSLDHLRVFGCKCYPLILNKDRDKFEPTARPNCVLVGYDNSDGIYWIFNKSTKSIFRSRDVTFNEQMFIENFSTFDKNDTSNQQLDELSIENDDDKDQEILDNVQEVVSGEFENDTEVHNDSEVHNDTEEQNEDQYEDANQNSNELKNEIEIEKDDDTRKSNRIKKQPERLVVDPNLKSYVIDAVEGELNDPQNINEALTSPNADKWKQAIKSELDSMKENDVWQIVNRPAAKVVIGTRWVFKIKRNSNNELERFKARLVAKGYNQKYGIDYYETFSPVVRVQTLRAIFAIAANCDLEVHQIDIDTAFLNGKLEEEIYVEAPPGCNICPTNQVCKLNKSLYGLKQAPRAWNTTLVKFLSEYGLTQLKSDVCVFVNKHLILAIYVDDLVIAGKNADNINNFKMAISRRFKAKDLGKINYVLKIKVEQIPGGGWKLHQHNYIDDLIKMYGLNNEKIVEIPIQPNHRLTVDLNDEKELLKEPVDITNYRQAIGKLMYLMVCTRPDISYAVSLLSRFMAEPKEKHWRFIKQLLKYIKSTRDYSLIYPKQNVITLTGYSDSDHAGDLSDRKSTSGFIFILSGCAISWRSNKQKTVAISSTEAEYIGLSDAAQEAIWLKKLINELGTNIEQVTICGDNLSSMQIVKNSHCHNRSKHIDVRYHFIKDHYTNGNISLQYIESEKLCADFLTKGVNKLKHYGCMKQINLTN